MAVKKRELADSRSQLDLAALAKYIQALNEQSSYLPSVPELPRRCQEIVRVLARTSVVNDDDWGYLQLVEDFFVRVVTTVPESLRQEIINAVIEQFYSHISDPQSESGPVTSIALVVFEGLGDEAMLSAARWLVRQNESATPGAGYGASLACLYRWCGQWQGTPPALGHWILAFIKALEENNNFNILIEVSLDSIEVLFLALDALSAAGQAIADVILNVMARLRSSIDAFERLAPHVGRVLVNLAEDSGQFSRQLLQNVVDILTAMVNYFVGVETAGESGSNNASPKHGETFKEKYGDVISCLEKHMESRGCPYLQNAAWSEPVDGTKAVAVPPPIKKMGLNNLGNTCYMNSVIQALLATKPFTSHAMLKGHSSPYWEKICVLFAKMLHSKASKLNPAEVIQIVRPSFFSIGSQHDSSEFLGYLLSLLHSYEFVYSNNFDYSRPPPSLLIRSDPETETSQRAVSPRPGSSGGSSSRKTRSFSEEDAPPRKVRVTTEVKRESFIEHLFGGTQITRVKCGTCHLTSLSRDSFRDIQLAFPEKPLHGDRHSIQDLLEFYCTKERLCGSNKYLCRECNALKEAEKQVLIEKAPKYLILIVKHFEFDPETKQQLKLMYSAKYNPLISLPTVRSHSEHSIYCMYAAIIHSGTSLDSGHYYTMVCDNNTWHICNDATVTPSHPAALNNLRKDSTPYILFYRRRDIEDTVLPTIDELPTRVRSAVESHNKRYGSSKKKR